MVGTNIGNTTVELQSQWGKGETLPKATADFAADCGLKGLARLKQKGAPTTGIRGAYSFQSALVTAVRADLEAGRGAPKSHHGGRDPEVEALITEVFKGVRFSPKFSDADHSAALDKVIVHAAVRGKVLNSIRTVLGKAVADKLAGHEAALVEVMLEDPDLQALMRDVAGKDLRVCLDLAIACGKKVGIWNDDTCLADAGLVKAFDALLRGNAEGRLRQVDETESWKGFVGKAGLTEERAERLEEYGQAPKKLNKFHDRRKRGKAESDAFQIYPQPPRKPGSDDKANRRLDGLLRSALEGFAVTADHGALKVGDLREITRRIDAWDEDYWGEFPNALVLDPDKAEKIRALEKAEIGGKLTEEDQRQYAWVLEGARGLGGLIMESLLSHRDLVDSWTEDQLKAASGCLVRESSGAVRVKADEAGEESVKALIGSVLEALKTQRQDDEAVGLAAAIEVRAKLLSWNPVAEGAGTEEKLDQKDSDAGIEVQT